jgi:glycosidase
MSWTLDDGHPAFTTGTPFRAHAANFAWNNYAVQRADPDSIFHFYKAMLALRRTRPSLALGEYDSAVVRGTTLGFRRYFEGEETLVGINVGIDWASVTFTGLSNSATWYELWVTPGTNIGAPDGGTLTIWIPPQGVAVYARGG